METKKKDMRDNEMLQEMLEFGDQATGGGAADYRTGQDSFQRVLGFCFLMRSAEDD